jgi:hypothetical protein
VRGLTIDVIRKKMLARRNDLDIAWVLPLLQTANVRRGVTAGQNGIFTRDCMAQRHERARRRSARTNTGGMGGWRWRRAFLTTTPAPRPKNTSVTPVICTSARLYISPYNGRAEGVSYQRGSLKRLISGAQRAPPAGTRARLSVEIVDPTRFHSESFSEAPIPSADGKEVGQYFRPAESTPHPALTPCRASPVGTAGTPRRGMPPCVTCAIFSSKVASESLHAPIAWVDDDSSTQPRVASAQAGWLSRSAHRFLIRSSVGTLALQYAPIVSLHRVAGGFPASDDTNKAVLVASTKKASSAWGNIDGARGAVLLEYAAPARARPADARTLVGTGCIRFIWRTRSAQEANIL